MHTAESHRRCYGSMVPPFLFANHMAILSLVVLQRTHPIERPTAAAREKRQMVLLLNLYGSLPRVRAKGTLITLYHERMPLTRKPPKTMVGYRRSGKGRRAIMRYAGDRPETMAVARKHQVIA